jgi:ubiquinone/menaquinone biosynthesis C-methylase UbiE
MEENTKKEKLLKKQYQDLWQDERRINRDNENLLLGWHLGYYEKGVRGYKQALINMNNYVGRLLKLTEEKQYKILDSGCGVGGTSLHLAKKYPKTHFFGITLAENELKLADKLKKDLKIQNVEFLQKSYNNTGFSENYFDGIFALETICYAEDIELVVKELKRILKPEGKIVIIDIFRKYNRDNSFISGIKNNVLRASESTKDVFTIDEFENSIKNHEFKNITVKNLTKTRNVKPLILYSFLYSYLFKYLSENYKNKTKKEKANSFINGWKLFLRFSIKSLILFISKPGYYSVTAEKK